MACVNTRSEAYTASGEATLLSLEIHNDDVLSFIILGAAPETPRQARRDGSSGVTGTIAEPQDGSPRNLGGPVTARGAVPAYKERRQPKSSWSDL